jgi:hypothetical protein
MALDKLKHQYTEPLQVSSLSVDGNLNASNVIINGVTVTPSTYLTTSNASTTYLTISNAVSTYSPIVGSINLTTTGTLTSTGNGTIIKMVGSSNTYQGYAVQHNSASASSFGGVFYDARNENNASVANFLADINTDGSSAWSWSTQIAGARTDRRAERMRITSTGNVAINTTSSNVRGSGSGQYLTVGGSGNAGGVLELFNTNTDGIGNYGTIVIAADGNTLAANKSIAQIEAYTTGTTANNRGGILIFSTKADGGVSTVRLTIDNTGLSTFSGTLSATAAPGTTTSASQLGYMGMPQNLNPGAYTIAATDNGKHIYYTTTGQTLTIPANGTLALPIGFSVAVINAAAVTTSIAITTDIMYLAGTGTTGTRTLAPYGVATIIKITATSWMISGNGLT